MLWQTFRAALLFGAAQDLVFGVAHQQHTEVSVDALGLLDKSRRAILGESSSGSVMRHENNQPYQPPAEANPEGDEGDTFVGTPHLNFYAHAGCTDYASQLRLPEGMDWTKQRCVKVKSHVHKKPGERDIFLTLECIEGDAKVVMYDPDRDPTLDCKKPENLFDSIQVPARDAKNGLEECQQGMTSGGFQGWVSIKEVDSGTTLPSCMRAWTCLDVAWFLLYAIGGLLLCALVVGVVILGKRWYEKSKSVDSSSDGSSGEAYNSSNAAPAAQPLAAGEVEKGAGEEEGEAEEEDSEEEEAVTAAAPKAATKASPPKAATKATKDAVAVAKASSNAKRK